MTSMILTDPYGNILRIEQWRSSHRVFLIAQEGDMCAEVGPFGPDDVIAAIRGAAGETEQEPTGAEIEAGIQADTDSLAAEIHEAVEFQYDQCDHGTYQGGHLHGEPYQMCRINAERIVRRRAARREEETDR